MPFWEDLTGDGRAPLGARGLKSVDDKANFSCDLSRSARSAWIEIDTYWDKRW